MVKPKRNVSFVKEFFKVYLSDLSSRQLSLPPAFGIQFNGKDEALPKNATLKDGNTKIWQVGLVKREGLWVINDGWKEFACYHSLVDGDFLIFKYDGISEFEVELYCKHGLKIEGRENFPLNQTKLHQGKKTFQAIITECLPHGYTIETTVDGKPLRGILFSNKPSSPQIVNQNNSRKRASAEIGVGLNGDYNSKPKTSKTHKQDAEENMQPDNAHEKESTTQEPKTEAAAVPDLKNLASSNVYQPHEAPQNAEPPVAPTLNLNDDMISDAPNSDTGFSKV